MALASGIERLTVYKVVQVAAQGSLPCETVSIECSTPQAKHLLDALFTSDWFNLEAYSISTREIRSLASTSLVSQVTRPMPEPALDVIEDLWQLTHTTPSYYGRAAAGGLLLADGMYHNNPISIVVAALFLPFLSQLLALALGGWARTRRLAQQGFWAVTVSTVLCLLAGAALALVQGMPMDYAGFRTPVSGLFFACVIGVTAGLCSADDTGRRYLIGVAAAVQCGVYPVWIGATLVAGGQPDSLLLARLGLFLCNLIAIAGCAMLTYALVGLGSREAIALSEKLRH
jgi:hypothetical protein